MTDVQAAIAALRAGGVVVIPTDTVYGLAVTAHSEASVTALYELKGRAGRRPTAVVAAGVEQLLDAVPEAPERVLRALLPGPYTLVVSNPAGRLSWLCGDDPATIGVRVPAVDGVAREVLEGAGLLAATSANLPGGGDPSSVSEIPRRLLDAVAAIVDIGALPGTASTVVDLTGPAPTVLREGAVSAAETLTVVNKALKDP